jgi:hypothetical protein
VRFLHITFWMALAAMLQMMLPADLPLMLGFLVVLALSAERALLTAAAVTAALLNDVFSPLPLGISFPFYLLVAEAILRIRAEVFYDQLITYCILGGLAACSQVVYFGLVLTLTGLRSPGMTDLFMRLAGAAVAGAAVTPLIYLPSRHLQRRLRDSWRYVH